MQQAFEKNIIDFLVDSGFQCKMENGVLWVCVGSTLRPIVLYDLVAGDILKAEEHAEFVESRIRELTGKTSFPPIVISEDRWNRQRNLMKYRLLSHLEVFLPVYARNCIVRKISKEEAATFLNVNHSYGDAVSRYRYGLFIRRHTGHATDRLRDNLEVDTLVAVATFSNARKWVKGEKVICSYEWTRYASLPQLRIVGGMGKVLKAFIHDINPDDIMSYADLEWSEGTVYEQLGFTLEGHKSAVIFEVDEDWKRTPLKYLENEKRPQDCGRLYLKNFGSNKYRLKLTDYQ